MREHLLVLTTANWRPPQQPSASSCQAFETVATSVTATTSAQTKRNKARPKVARAQLQRTRAACAHPQRHKPGAQKEHRGRFRDGRGCGRQGQIIEVVSASSGVYRADRCRTERGIRNETNEI